MTKYICKNCSKEYEVDITFGKWNKNNIQTVVHGRKHEKVIDASKYCCYACGIQAAQNKIKQTCIDKYGVENPGQLPEIKQKIKNTSLQKYGVENPGQSQKAKEKRNATFAKNFKGGHPFKDPTIKRRIKQILLNKYGVDTPSKSSEIVEKRKQTSVKKRGVECPFQDENVKQKIRHTNLQKYGVENPLQNKKIIEKCKASYKNRTGYDNPSQNPIVKEKKEKTCLKHYNVKYHNQCEAGKQTRRKTCLQKYGVSNYFQSNEYKSLYENENWVKNKQKKSYETKNKNHTWVYSSYEKTILELLLQKFAEVKTQYLSEKYPFNCDFYVPEKDLYIEYQGHWSHGKEPYNKNNVVHKQILQQWKNKHAKGYRDSIYVWTKLDPKKRQFAKKNKLNWIEFFNMIDFIKWYDNI